MEKADKKKLEEAIVDASEIIESVMNGEDVSYWQDEAEKWLREYAPNVLNRNYASSKTENGESI